MGFGYPFRLRSGDQLCLLQVPGTGSAGLLQALQHRVAPQSSRRLAANEIAALDSWPLEAFDGWRLIHGNIGYDIYRCLARRPVFVALLRHPLERTLDLFFRGHGQPSQAAETASAAWEDALLEFVCDPACSAQIVNPQTRCIAVGADPESAVPSDKVMLEMAKIHLEEFGFFGLAERATETVQLLDYTFGWAPSTAPPPQTWVSPPCPAISRLSARAAETIRERTFLDVELYDFACELFQWRYTLMLTRLLRTSFAQNWWGQNADRIDCWQLVDRLSASTGVVARSALRILEKLAGL